MKIKFLLAFLICISTLSFGQKLKPYNQEDFIKFLRADENIGRYYLSVKVATDVDSTIQIWIMNSDLYRLLSDQFKTYGAYADTIKAKLSADQTLGVSRANMEILKKCMVVIPAFQKDEYAAVIKTYFDSDKFLKDRYNEQDRDVQGVLAWLFENGFLLCEDDSENVFISGVEK